MFDSGHAIRPMNLPLTGGDKAVPNVEAQSSGTRKPKGLARGSESPEVE